MDKMKKTTAFILLFALTALIPSSFAAGLSKNDYDQIKTAFINGYVRALRLDMKKIESLKENQGAMEDFVSYQADEYMEEVLKLNM